MGSILWRKEGESIKLPVFIYCQTNDMPILTNYLISSLPRTVKMESDKVGKYGKKY